MATLGVPDSAGISQGAAAETLVAPFNNMEAVKRIFDELGEEIAAVIVEPIAANTGLVPPKPSFLADLRVVTRKHGAVLVFDEVITGFRAAHGGAQAFFGIEPDLTCLGKIIGGGLPVGAYGGRADIMELVAPLGPVYQAGTLSGNPLAMTAGIATLKEIRRKGFYHKLDSTSANLARGLQNAADSAGVRIQLNRVASMVGLFFTGQEVYDYASAKSSDTERFRVFFHSMLENGIYLPPSAFETIFLSAAHNENDIAKTRAAAELAFRKTLVQTRTVAA
jgi:glutamate-1-semialdehyde 2,1-aminomutase